MNPNLWLNPIFQGDKPIVDYWYRVPKKYLTKESLQLHKTNLSIKANVLNYMTGKELPPTICFNETDTELLCPYFYGFVNFGTNVIDNRNYGYNNNVRSGLDCNEGEELKDFKEYKEFKSVPFNGTLDEKILKQDSACRAVLQSLMTPLGCSFLALPPGGGKTVCACYIWSELCKIEKRLIPLLVLVEREFILDQWVERIHQYLPDARVGTMRGNIKDYENKDIVLCTIQSLITRVKDKFSGGLQPRFEKEIMEYFGILFIDEAHHISAKKFSQAFQLTGMKKMLLLSGTPDKHHSKKVSESWAGPVTFQTDKKYTRKVYVHVTDLEYEPLDVKLNYKKKPDFNKMLNDLVECDKRNADILTRIYCLAKEGRRVLVLSKRVQHLHILSQLLSDKDPNIGSALFYGKTKKSDRKKALEAQIIFATFQMASEALDIPGLSAVVLSTPESDIVQAIMRCIRGAYQDFDPIIIDFRDNFGMWWGKWNSRYKYYKKEKFILVYLSKNNDTLKDESLECDEYDEEDIIDEEMSDISYPLIDNGLYPIKTKSESIKNKSGIVENKSHSSAKKLKTIRAPKSQMSSVLNQKEKRKSKTMSAQKNNSELFTLSKAKNKEKPTLSKSINQRLKRGESVSMEFLVKNGLLV